MSSSAPPMSQPEALTVQFYSWEQRGRGWPLWEYPVRLEPPFAPFAHVLPAPTPYDDGRTTFLQSILPCIFRPQQRNEAAPIDFAPLDPQFSDTSSEPYVELPVALAPDVEVSADVSEQFLISLASCRWPVSFEVVGTEAQISVQLAAQERDASVVRDQLRAHHPQAVVSPADRDVLRASWHEAGAHEEVIADFGLSNEFMRPITTFSRFGAVDPLTAIVGALSDLHAGECGVFQVLFLAARAPWADSVIRAVTDWSGDAFFADDPKMVSLAREKITRPLFAAVVRIAGRSRSHGRGWDIVRRLAGALRQFSDPASNELIPLTNDGYDDEAHAFDLLTRQSRRCGMLLNSEELVGLAHLPSPAVQSERLRRQVQRTKAAPASASNHSYILGENMAGGRTVSVGLSWEQRVRHVHVIGASGTGKSTLLLHLIAQDLDHGTGFAVLDPHGDLIDDVLGRVPEQRIEDVILVDPSDAEWPIGCNMLSAHSEQEQTLLASDLVAGFRRLATSWGDQMTSVLSNAVLAFLESERGGTLLDLRRFLVEPEFRKEFLPSVRDPEVVYYWQKEFPLLTGRPQAPLLTRLDTFLRSRLVRNMVSQRRNALDVAAIMDQGKVLLVKLAQGSIGEENASLLGTLFIAKFHQVALGRQETKEQQRRPFTLYVDEFHNFITPSMASILSGARKFRLGLVLAHQELRQLAKDPDVSSAVLSNAATRICFRVGDADAEKLAEGFSAFSADDLMNLGVGEAICRIERSQQDFNLRTIPSAPVNPALAQEHRERLLSLSRRQYATPRPEIEAVPPSPTAPAPPSVLPFPRQPAPAIEEPRRQRTRSQAEPSQTNLPAPIPPAPVVATAPVGRGGPQHQYLQQLIKRWAQEKGFLVRIEQAVLDGLGSVDVSLERDDRRIACEICVTTGIEHELENVQKCLAAGFEAVFLVAVDQRALRRIREALQTQLDEEQAERVRALAPEELFAFLQQDAAAKKASAAEVSMVKGYKVKVSYSPGGEADGRRRTQAIAQTVLGAMRRLAHK
jgi:hypothetical protein